MIVSEHAGEVGATEEGANAMVMTLLHKHIPLSLIHDLWSPDGPESWEILAVEAGWLDPRSLDQVGAARP